MEIKITKRRHKSKPTYKYKKIYFVFGGQSYYLERREDLFLHKKTESWFYFKTTYRYDKDRLKTYEYKKWYELTDSPVSIEKFNKAYDLYNFNLRQNKLKRLVK